MIQKKKSSSLNGSQRAEADEWKLEADDFPVWIPSAGQLWATLRPPRKTLKPSLNAWAKHS